MTSVINDPNQKISIGMTDFRKRIPKEMSIDMALDCINDEIEIWRYDDILYRDLMIFYVEGLTNQLIYVSDRYKKTRRPQDLYEAEHLAICLAIISGYVKQIKLQYESTVS